MKYQEAMSVLSQSGLGALVMEADSRILAVNQAGDALLHGAGKLKGKLLSEIALPLSMQSEKPVYATVAFGEYLLRCPTPEVENLPPHTQLIVFRNATADAMQDILMNVVNQLSEALFVCDADSRILFLNDAGVRMESMDLRDIRGARTEDVYQMRDGSKNNVPEVIRTRKPKLNHRQYYTTRYGKDVDIVSNNYPIVQNGQILGGFSVMEDWSRMDSLHKQILELQEKLRNHTASGKSRTASKLTAKYTFDDIVHISEPMRHVVSRCKQVAKSDSSVMIYGETGTGKELLAQSIHNASRRKDGPFLAINCAAIPENLLESLLFGTEKGAYTGAERRPGLFEQADGGTLLLDEINSMNLGLQAKLLRVLQEGTVRRVGGATEISVDVRVLSNTNIPPYQAMEEKKLRRDLFYRLGVVNITIPPLRERKEDIPLLVKTFIMQCNRKLERNIRDADRHVLDAFYAYDWPGNVRELQHAVEHAMNVLPDEYSMITAEYIPEHIGGAAAQAEQSASDKQRDSLASTMKDMEYNTICRVLKETGGNISESARMLQMSRQKLQYRIKRHRIDVQKLRE